METSSRKLIEINKIKPKTKVGLISLLNLLDKWRYELKKKLIIINFYKLSWMSLDMRNVKK